MAPTKQMVGAIFLTALQPTLAILALRPAQGAVLAQGTALCGW